MGCMKWWRRICKRCGEEEYYYETGGIDVE
jgi:hypothetical protein